MHSNDAPGEEKVTCVLEMYRSLQLTRSKEKKYKRYFDGAKAATPKVGEENIEVREKSESMGLCNAKFRTFTPPILLVGNENLREFSKHTLFVH